MPLRTKVPAPQSEGETVPTAAKSDSRPAAMVARIPAV